MRTRALAGRRRKAAVVIVGLSLVGGAAVIASRRVSHGRHERAIRATSGIPTRPESRPEEPEVARMSRG